MTKAQKNIYGHKSIYNHINLETYLDTASALFGQDHRGKGKAAQLYRWQHHCHLLFSFVRQAHSKPAIFRVRTTALPKK